MKLTLGQMALWCHSRYSNFLLQNNHRIITYNKKWLINPKTYNSSNIEQLDVRSVWLRHKDKVVRCRFFVVTGTSPALLGKLDIELLELLKIVCEVLDQHQIGRKFNLQTIETSSAQEQRTNTVNARSAGITNNCTNMLDYFRFRKTGRQAKRQAEY